MAGWCSAVGWNWKNSTSATGHPGPQRHGDAVAGGLDRVGGDRVELAGAAGGQHHVAGPDLADARRRGRGPPPRRSGPPSTSRSRANHCSSTAAAVCSHGRHEGPLDLGPGGRPAGVQDPGRRVAALAGPGQVAAGLAVEHGAQGDQLARPAPGPRRRAPARRRRRTGRPRRPGCRPGAGRSSPRPRRARRPRRPGPSGWPTGRARPWSARRPACPAPRPGGRRPTGRPRRCRGRGRRAPPPVALPTRGRGQPVTARERLGLELGRRAVDRAVIVDRRVGGVDVDDGGREAARARPSRSRRR